MTNSVTVNGNTYNDGNVAPNNMGAGGHRTNLLPMLSDSVADLAAKAAAALASQNAAAASATSAAGAPGTNATSATSMTIGTGNQSFTMTAGKAYSVGQQLVIASTASPANWMAGTLTAYNSGTGVATLTASNISGSGTFASWSVGLSGAPGVTGVLNELKGANIASAGTVNLDTATGNLVHITGTTTITAVTLAVGSERTAIFDAVLTLTNGASLLLPGGANITTAANDRMIVRGDTAGAIVVDYVKADGTSVVSSGITTVGSSITTSATLTATSAGYQPVAMTTLGQSVTLPDATTLKVGSPKYIIDNTKGSYPVGIRDSTGVLIMAVGAGGEGIVSLRDVSTAAGIWSVTGTNLEPGLITIDSTFSSTYSGSLYSFFAALDNNTSVHTIKLFAGGIAAFICDNAGKVITTPVTLSAASSSPIVVYKTSATRAAVFWTEGATYKAVGVTITGVSPNLVLTADATPISTTEPFFYQEQLSQGPQIAQLQPTLFLATYCATSGANPTKAVGIFDTGTQLIFGTPVNVIATSSVANTTTTYTKTSLIGECIYLSGSVPYAVNAVPVSVTLANPPVCSIGTPATGGNMSAANQPPSVNLSATKTFIQTDNGTTTTVQIQSITTTGTVSTISAVLTVETGAANVAANYGYGTRMNPALWMIGPSSAGLAYTDSNGASRALIVTDGLPPTMGAIAYQSICNGVNSAANRGTIQQQGATEFISLIQLTTGASGNSLAVLPSRINGSNITIGGVRPIFPLLGPVANNTPLTARLSSGKYVVLANYATAAAVFTSNGQSLSQAGGISMPYAQVTPANYPALLNTFANRIPLMVVSILGNTTAVSTAQQRFINLEIAA